MEGLADCWTGLGNFVFKLSTLFRDGANVSVHFIFRYLHTRNETSCSLGGCVEQFFVDALLLKIKSNCFSSELWFFDDETSNFS